MTDLIPAFEGHPVAHTAVKITGRLVSDDLDGYVLKHDDVVQVLTQFRVVGVHHDTDDKTGEITRIQILRPIEMVLAPIDPDDPSDDGIIRAIPQATQTRGLPAVSPGDTEDED